MSAPKIVLSVIWLACLASFGVGGDSLWATAGRVTFAVMVLAHLVECVVFSAELRRAGGSFAGHLAQVFLFGVLHLREVRAGQG